MVKNEIAVFAGNVEKVREQRRFSQTQVRARSGVNAT